MAGDGRKYYCMRPMELDDVNTVSAWFEHLADLAIFDRNTPVPTNKTVLEGRWKETLSADANPKSYWFGIEDQDGKLIGITGLEGINYVNGDAIIAGYMADESRGKGIGLLISGAILDLAFDQLRLNRITTYYRDDNEASAKITKNVGFVNEGCKRNGWYSGGKYHDVITVGILASEWKQARKSLISKLGKTKEIQFGRAPWTAKLWPEKLA